MKCRIPCSPAPAERGPSSRAGGAQREQGRLPATVVLRKELKTWATVRLVQAPGANARYPETDIVVIRETSEDIYSGMEHEITDGVYEAVKVTTQSAWSASRDSHSSTPARTVESASRSSTSRTS